MSEPLVIIREMREADRRFVESSFFESYLKALGLRTLPFEVFKHGMNMRIERLMRTSFVLVAAPKAAVGEILGYALVDREHGATHWMYVKALFRRQGIATQLARVVSQRAKHRNTYTHQPSKEGLKFLRALGMEFNPALGEPESLRKKEQ